MVPLLFMSKGLIPMVKYSPKENMLITIQEYNELKDNPKRIEPNGKLGDILDDASDKVKEIRLSKKLKDEIVYSKEACTLMTQREYEKYKNNPLNVSVYGTLEDCIQGKQD